MKRVCGTQKIVSIVNSRARPLETDQPHIWQQERSEESEEVQFNKGGKPEITVTE